MRPLYKLTILIVVLINLLLFIGIQQSRKMQHSPMVGRYLPEFQLEYFDQKDEYLTSQSFHEEFVLINVFASWCKNCRKEHQTLMWIDEQKIVPIYGIIFRDTEENIKHFIGRLGNPYKKMANDKDGKFAIEMGVSGFPETFLVDKQGKIVYIHNGPMTRKVFENKIKPLVLNGVGN